MSVLYTPVTCPECLAVNQVEYFSDNNTERCAQCNNTFIFIEGEKLFLAKEGN